MGRSRSVSEDQNRALAASWPPFFEVDFSIVFCFDFWSVLPPKMVPKWSKNQWKIDEKTWIDFDSVFWWFVDRFWSSSRRPRLQKSLKKTIGFYIIFAIEVFLCWGPFWLRFDHQLGSISVPKLVQNRNQKRSKNWWKNWSIFWSIFGRFWHRFWDPSWSQLGHLNL